MPPEAQNHPEASTSLAYIIGRLLGGIVVVAVDEGLPQIGAAGQAGLFQPKRPEDPLPELLLVGLVPVAASTMSPTVTLSELEYSYCVPGSKWSIVLHEGEQLARLWGFFGLSTSASRKP